MQISRYANGWIHAQEDNLFLNQTEEQQYFCSTFPLMHYVKKIEQFDFKNNPIDYDLLLDEFESELNYYLEDLSDVYVLTHWQKTYLLGYYNFLRAELFEIFN